MRARLNRLLLLLVWLIAAVCVGYLTTRHHVSSDWSSQEDASVSDSSQAILKQLDDTLSITSYARPGDEQRRHIRAFISRYQRVKPDIDLHFVNPENDPAATRRAGITVNGELLIRYHGRQQYVRKIDEQHVTDALATLARDDTRIAAFVTGDGERLPARGSPGDLSRFSKQLQQRGVRTVPLNFSDVASVPQGARLVVLASPTQRLSDTAVTALLDYVHSGGNLLWLSEPDTSDLGLKPLAQALNVRRLPGTLVSDSDSAGRAARAQRLSVNRYPDHRITDDFRLTTYFPQVAAWAQTARGEWKLNPILRTNADSRTVRHPDRNARPADSGADSGSARGPLNFGLVMTRLSVNPSHNEQRVAVIGDGDFLSNAWLGKGGNRELGSRLFNWLLGDDALIDVPPPQAAPQLDMTQAALNTLVGVFLLAVPLILIVAGLLLAWRRRRC